MTIKLKAPTGTDEANYGDQRFAVADDGTIEVPEEAVDSLVRVGGFTRVETEAAEPPKARKGTAKPAGDGLVAMAHPEGAGCSFGGQDYPADKNGMVRVPNAAVADLEAHGFKVAG